MSGRALIAVLAVCLAVLAGVVYRAQFTSGQAAVPATARVVTAASPGPATPGPTASSSPSPPPASLRIAVPYTPQAPRADWSTHEDYCEAAALLMYADFLAGDARSRIPAAEAERQMDPLVAWERQTQARPHPDLTMAEIGTEAAHFYQLVARVEPAGLDSIRARLAAGSPVIVPVMTHGGPGGAAISPHYGASSVYHVILLVGYTADGRLIANDAGFMQGQYWTYTWPVLEAAIQAQERTMSQGQVMLTLGTS